MLILLFPLMSLKACHPLPVSRVRSGTGRAAFPLRPGVVESVRQSLAFLMNALQAAFAAYPCRRKDGRLRFSGDPARRWLDRRVLREVVSEAGRRPYKLSDDGGGREISSPH